MGAYQYYLDDSRTLFASEVSAYRNDKHVGHIRFVPETTLKELAYVAVKEAVRRAAPDIVALIADRPDFLDYNNGISRLSPRDGILTALEVSLNADLADEIAAEHVKGQDDTTLPTLLSEAATVLRRRDDIRKAETLERMVKAGEFDRGVVLQIAADCGERAWMEILGAVSAREAVLAASADLVAAGPTPR